MTAQTTPRLIAAYVGPIAGLAAYLRSLGGAR